MKLKVIFLFHSNRKIESLISSVGLSIMSLDDHWYHIVQCLKMQLNFIGFLATVLRFVIWIITKVNQIVMVPLNPTLDFMWFILP